MSPYIFQLGSFELRYYSVLIVAGLLLAMFMCRIRSKQLGYDYQKVENIILFLFFFALIGARGYYVILKWGYYSRNPLEIFAVWHGGLAIHGGILMGLLGAWLGCWYYKYKLFFLADLIAPWVLVGQALGRIGNYMNGEAHGVPTITPPDIIFSLKPDFPAFWHAVMTKFQLANTPESISRLMDYVHQGTASVIFNGKEYILQEYVPWGISFTNKYMPAAYIDFGTLPVHPTFFYEMILNFTAAFIMYMFFWRKDSWVGTGVLFGLYMISYGVIRSFVTFFRADDLMVGFLRAPHLASLGFFILGVVLIINARRLHKKKLAA